MLFHCLKHFHKRCVFLWNQGNGQDRLRTCGLSLNVAPSTTSGCCSWAEGMFKLLSRCLSKLWPQLQVLVFSIAPDTNVAISLSGTSGDTKTYGETETQYCQQGKVAFMTIVNHIVSHSKQSINQPDLTTQQFAASNTESCMDGGAIHPDSNVSNDTIYVTTNPSQGFRRFIYCVLAIAPLCDPVDFPIPNPIWNPYALSYRTQTTWWLARISV